MKATVFFDAGFAIFHPVFALKPVFCLKKLQNYYRYEIHHRKKIGNVPDLQG